MSTLMSGRRGGQWLSVLAASTILTMAGGAVDAWIYFAHGHVFANAQSGNVVLMGIAFASGDVASGVAHLPSLLAFTTAALASRLSGQLLKRRHLNSRNVRLTAVCIMLVALGLFADHMPNLAVTACAGFIAGLQMTSLSHIGSWSFNTGMTTGNLLAGVSALAKALTGSAKEWPHAATMFLLCFAFGVGAVTGAWLTPRLAGATLLAAAALVAVAVAVSPRGLDPIPEWSDLE